MKHLFFRAFVLASIATLGACATIAPSGPDAPLVLPPASENVAVLALLDQAQTESGAGRAQGASATLERALRIEPRNGRLWLELARHHLAQGDSEQAEQFAVRANALAGTDRKVRAAGWLLIAEARRARDDEAGARQADGRALELRR